MSDKSNIDVIKSLPWPEGFELKWYGDFAVFRYEDGKRIAKLVMRDRSYTFNFGPKIQVIDKVTGAILDTEVISFTTVFTSSPGDTYEVWTLEGGVWSGGEPSGDDLRAFAQAVADYILEWDVGPREG